MPYALFTPPARIPAGYMDQFTIEGDLTNAQVTSLLRFAELKLRTGAGSKEQFLARQFCWDRKNLRALTRSDLLETLQFTLFEDATFNAEGKNIHLVNPPKFIRPFKKLLPTRFVALGQEWIGTFFSFMLKEIRKVVCNKNAGGLLSRASCLAIAATITQKCGVSNPIAIGIATTSIIAIAQATRNTFCEMTDEKVVAAIQGQNKIVRKKTLRRKPQTPRSTSGLSRSRKKTP